MSLLPLPSLPSVSTAPQDPQLQGPLKGQKQSEVVAVGSLVPLCCRHHPLAALLQGAGLHALNCTGLLLPVVSAPVHQPAWALVCHLLLPVPGPVYGKCVTAPPWQAALPDKISIQSKGIIG